MTALNCLSKNHELIHSQPITAEEMKHDYCLWKESYFSVKLSIQQWLQANKNESDN